MTLGFQDNPTNILGADNNNNLFASTNVAANADGSVIERQEDIKDRVVAVKAETALIKTEADKIAAIKTETDLLGAPAGATHAADTAAIKAETALIKTEADKIGAPAGASVSVDIAAVKAETALIKTEVDKIGAPAAASVSADVAAVKADTAAIKAVTDVLPDAGALTTIGNNVQRYGDGYLVSKEITYAGGASYAAFTVTGLVAVKVIGYITTALTNHADTTSVGTTTSVAGIIAATAGTAMQTANQIWVDNSPAKFESAGLVGSMDIIGDGEDIAITSTANLAAGVVTLYCFWKPISANGNVVAAA